MKCRNPIGLAAVACLCLVASPTLAVAQDGPGQTDRPATVTSSSKWSVTFGLAPYFAVAGYDNIGPSDPDFQRVLPEARARYELAPWALLQFGAGPDGFSVGAAMRYRSPFDWEYWLDVNFGYLSYSGLDSNVTLGVSLGAGLTYSVSERFGVGPYARVVHEIRTARGDRDRIGIGILLVFTPAHR